MTPGQGVLVYGHLPPEDRHAAVVQGSAVATRRKRASRGAVQRRAMVKIAVESLLS